VRDRGLWRHLRANWNSLDKLESAGNVAGLETATGQ
jgi:hypothetical protein